MNVSVTQHLRVFEPHPGLYAYHDGRVPGYRFMEVDNWVDDGAIAPEIAAYALVEGDAALVYDTHVSVAHGAAGRLIWCAPFADVHAKNVAATLKLYGHG